VDCITNTCGGRREPDRTNKWKAQVGSIAGDADKALGHGLAPSRGSDKRRSSGAWAGSTRPRHPLSSSAQNHLRAPARQPGLGSAECLWRRSEPLTRSRRRRLRARWRDIHFRSPDPQEFYSRGALRRRIPLLLRRVVGVKAHGTSAEHSVVRIPARRRRARNVGVVVMTSSNHDPSDRLQI